MKKLLMVFLFGVFATALTNAQLETCNCINDLEFIVAKLKKMPSFKKQIKGQKKTLFDNTTQQLKRKMFEPIPVEQCYQLLLQQMLLINDVHASLALITKFLPKGNDTSTESIAKFKSTDQFKKHPKYVKSHESLEQELQPKKQNDLEGIYRFGNERIGMVYSENKEELLGVVLKTDMPQWEPGEIRCIIKRYSDEKFNMYFYDAATRTPRFARSLSFENGRIWSYKKVGNTNNFEFLSEKIEVATFRQLTSNVQYLYFKTFNNNKSKELKAFIDGTKNKLTAENIIVDLRSNSGGNSKFSDVFLKLLRDKNVYVITNCFTGSNGEQFTLKLLKNNKAKHLGQTTRGIIAYGKNYGYSFTTPSGHFELTPTDMNFHKYIAYEGKGIVPEIVLRFDMDWIEQTIAIINSDKQD